MNTVETQVDDRYKVVGPAKIGRDMFIYASGKFPNSDVHQAAYIALAGKQYTSYWLKTIRDGLLANKTYIKKITDIANNAHRIKKKRLGEDSLNTWNIKDQVRKTFILAEEMTDVPDENLVGFLSTYTRGDEKGYNAAAKTAFELIKKYRAIPK